MSVEADLFSYRDYKKYLRFVLASKGPSRGKRTRLAEALGCRIAYISKVLNATAHFSLEHAAQASVFLGHSLEEQEYFMLLVHQGRAGSHLLEQHYERQLENVRRKRQRVSERIPSQRSLTLEDQLIYYNSWLPAAVHVLVSLPGFKTRSALAQYLGLPLAQISECVDFLKSKGVIVEANGRLRHGVTQIHLTSDSPMIAKHHTNWRIRAIQSLDRKEESDLHYSSAISFSRKDLEKIRNLLLKTIQDLDRVVAPSSEEIAYGLSMDLFRI